MMRASVISPCPPGALSLEDSLLESCCGRGAGCSPPAPLGPLFEVGAVVVPAALLQRLQLNHEVEQMLSTDPHQTTAQVFVGAVRVPRCLLQTACVP